MVIQCNACQTRFRLADEKLKADGTKVRCSKCGEIFVVMPPPPEPAATPTDFAREFPGAPAEAAPPPASGSDEGGAWSDFDLGAAAPGQPPAVAGPEAGREDFDFDREESETPVTAPADFDFPLAPAQDTIAEDDFDFPLPTGDDATAEEDFAFTVPTGDDTTTEDDFAFESEVSPPSPGAEDLDAFDFDPAEIDGTADELTFDGELGGGVEDDFAFEESSPEALPPLEDAAANDVFSWGGEDSAAPDEFDFNPGQGNGNDTVAIDVHGFDSVGVTTETAEPPRGTLPRPAPAPAVAERPPTASPAPLPASSGPMRASGPRRAKAPRRRRKSAVSGLQWFLLLLLLILGGAAGYFYWKGEIPDINWVLDRITSPQVQGPEVNKVKVSDLKSSFVTNREAGQLFVVTGQAVNGYNTPRSALSVKGAIFSRDGKVLQERTVYCGNTITESDLKSLSKTKLKERGDNQFGDSLSNLNLAPGKSLPFTIVFSDLPPDLAEFTVEPAASLPGTKQ